MISIFNVKISVKRGLVGFRRATVGGWQDFDEQQ